MMMLLFTPEQSMESRLMEAITGAEQRWRSVALTAVAVGGIAALLGLISLVVTLAR